MDFVVGLPLQGESMIQFVSSKSAHFLSVRTDYSLDKSAELYIKD